jgi:hypothetical protein
MPPSAPPKAIGVDVIAAESTEADRAAIAHLSARDRKSLPGMTYLVKIRLETKPEVTSHGWALYVSDLRIPKYWEYGDGIYFKVFDPQFFQDHEGEPLRFSPNGTDFIDTGLKLATPRAGTAATAAAATPVDLPAQDDALRSAVKRTKARGRPSAAKRRKRPSGATQG